MREMNGVGKYRWPIAAWNRWSQNRPENRGLRLLCRPNHVKLGSYPRRWWATWVRIDWIGVLLRFPLQMQEQEKERETGNRREEEEEEEEEKERQKQRKKELNTKLACVYTYNDICSLVGVYIYIHIYSVDGRLGPSQVHRNLMTTYIRMYIHKIVLFHTPHSSMHSSIYIRIHS